MRNRRILLLVLGLSIVFGMNGCKQINAKKSAEVNDAVIFQHKHLMTSLEEFIGALDSKDATLITTARERLLKSSTSGLIAIGDIASPDCNTDFIPAAKNIFTFYGASATGRYARIADYYSMDSISYAQFDSLQVLVKEMETAQQSADQEFLDAQQAFARECGFKLVRHVE
ncbi:MAG: hypothetical protein GY751_22140 [Bacteroidetes bacterium]|nr:hypothetical protein [Bacteroidota bacterium]